MGGRGGDVSRFGVRFAGDPQNSRTQGRNGLSHKPEVLWSRQAVRLLDYGDAANIVVWYLHAWRFGRSGNRRGRNGHRDLTEPLVHCDYFIGQPWL